MGSEGDGPAIVAADSNPPRAAKRRNGLVTALFSPCGTENRAAMLFAVTIPEPELTVALVVGTRRERATDCLRSILDQQGARLEILVVDLGIGVPPLPGADDPRVRTIVPRAGMLFAEARAIAVREARAPYIAFLEEHALAMEGWAAAIVAAHAEGWDGVGGEVKDLRGGDPVARVVSLMNDIRWLEPARAREVGFLPSHNSSYRRELLLRLGDELASLLRVESVLCQRLTRDGARLYLEPRVRFVHLYETSLRSNARVYFLYNRYLAVARAEANRWPAWKRMVYIAGSPLMPLHYLVKFFGVVRSERPDLLRHAIVGTPRILVAQLAAAMGHTIGLVAGVGNAEAEFSEYELCEEREKASGERR